MCKWNKTDGTDELRPGWVGERVGDTMGREGATNVVYLIEY